jgi:hypothetical protein
MLQRAADSYSETCLALFDRRYIDAAREILDYN